MICFKRVLTFPYAPLLASCLALQSGDVDFGHALSSCVKDASNFKHLSQVTKSLLVVTLYLSDPILLEQIGTQNIPFHSFNLCVVLLFICPPHKPELNPSKDNLNNVCVLKIKGNLL